MAMFPNYGKARFEIAFVYPSVDGSYNERKARGDIVPRNRWIDNLNSRSAYDALRPNGKEFLNNPDMEFYVRCNSGHTRQVISNLLDDPCPSRRVSLARRNRTMTFQRNPFLQVCIRQDQTRPMKTKAQLRQSPECEGRHLNPLKKRERSSRSRKKPITFMFHATYGENLINIMEHGLKSGRESAYPHGNGMHRQRYP